MSAFDLYRAAASAAGGYFVASTYNSHRSAYNPLRVVTTFPVSRWEGARLIVSGSSCHLVIVVNWIEGGTAVLGEYAGSSSDPTTCTWTSATAYEEQLVAAGFTVSNNGNMSPDVKTYS